MQMKSSAAGSAGLRFREAIKMKIRYRLLVQ